MKNLQESNLPQNGPRELHTFFATGRRLKGDVFTVKDIKVYQSQLNPDEGLEFLAYSPRAHDPHTGHVTEANLVYPITDQVTLDKFLRTHKRGSSSNWKACAVPIPYEQAERNNLAKTMEALMDFGIKKSGDYFKLSDSSGNKITLYQVVEIIPYKSRVQNRDGSNIFGKITICEVSEGDVSCQVSTFEDFQKSGISLETHGV